MGGNAHSQLSVVIGRAIGISSLMKTGQHIAVMYLLTLTGYCFTKGYRAMAKETLKDFVDDFALL